MSMLVSNGIDAQLLCFRGMGSVAAGGSWPAERSVERRRKLSPQAGMAIEKLGHAIEYLYDEFALESISGRSAGDFGLDPRIAAIDLLKRLNREIYLSSPVVPTFGQRMRSILTRKHA